MKILIVLMSFMLISCKSAQPTKTSDVLSNLINIHQSGKLKTLELIYGSPTKVETTNEVDIFKYTYDGASDSKDSFIAFVDKKNGNVTSSATMFWKSDDDYELLKKRFENYRWIETHIPTSPHPLRELYKVEVPELGISFEYDKLAPKIMWIFFKRPTIQKH